MAPLTTESTAGRPTLGDVAFQKIREDILRGRLMPGVKLRFQLLQEMYSLNVGTLREVVCPLKSGPP
jgi:DNA-binding GntR family transcriptional regulator